MDNAKFKKILLLSLPLIFAIALAITLAACMAQANSKPDDIILGGDSAPEASLPSGEPSDTTGPSENLSSSSSLEFTSNGDGTCSVTGLGSFVGNAVTVPEKSPKGDTVTAIGDSAFLGCSTLGTVSLPASLEKIGAYAFYGSSIESIIIPPSVKLIGECAFSNCTKLTSISVDRENEEYSSLDGVLFTKDKSELICYPSGKTNSSYTIRSSVKKIHKTAFYNCAALRTVTYNGKKDDWEKVEIGPNNDSLLNAEIKFSVSNK